jgi:hypothetical protein
VALFGKLFKRNEDKPSEETVASVEPIVLKPTTFNLNDTLRDVANILSLDAQEKRISIVYRMKKNVPSQVIGDRYKLSRLLTDLLGNAIDFTDKREDVVVQISRNEANEESLELHFEVTDYGIGLAENVVEEILMPMLTSDKPASVFGIKGEGLQRARDIIHAMQGSIRMTCSPKKGCCINFHIQMGAPDLNEKRHYRLPNKAGVGLKSLVVDNDMGSAKAVIPMLEYFRHEVTIGSVPDLENIASYDVVMISSEYWNDTVHQSIVALGDACPKVAIIESMIRHQEIEEEALDFADWLIYKPFTQQAVFEMLTAMFTDALQNAPEIEADTSEVAPAEEEPELTPCVSAFLNNGTMVDISPEEERMAHCKSAHQLFVAADGLMRYKDDYTLYVEQLKELIWKYVKADKVIAGKIEQGQLEDTAVYCAQIKSRASDLGIYRLACFSELLETACRNEQTKDIEALKEASSFVLAQTISALDQFIEQARFKVRS